MYTTPRWSMSKSGPTCKRRALWCPLSAVCADFFNVYDAFLTNRTVKRQVTICKSALEACKNAEAVVIATEWKEFKEIDWEAVYAGMNKPAFVFDGRLLVDAEKLTKIGFKVSLCFHFTDL